MDIYPPTPNLDVLLGRHVTVKLMAASGGLPGLAMLNGMKLRLLGLEEKKAVSAADKAKISQSTNASSSPQAGDAEKVLGGFIIESDLLLELLDGDVAGAVSSEPLVVRKAVDVLGNKCALASKADLSGSKQGGEYGKELAEEVKVAVLAAREKGKVDAGHVKALDAVDTRDDRKKRGGKQVRNAEKRERVEEEEAQSVIELVLSRFLSVTTIKDLGLSREERERRLLVRDDVKAAIALEEARRQERRARKAESQNNDLKANLLTDSQGTRSSGYLQKEFGVCLVPYDQESELYAKLASSV